MSRSLLSEMPVEGEETWNEWFDNLSDEDKHRIGQITKVAPRVGPQPGPQTMAFNSKAEVLGYGGDLDDNHVIRTPMGAVPHGQIKVGDKVFTPGGGVAKVLMVERFTDNPCFEMRFNDYRNTRLYAGTNHRWRAKINNGEFKTFKTSKLMTEFEKGHRIIIPTTLPNDAQVVGMRPVKSRPTTCIKIDHPDEEYLVSHCFITKNSAGGGKGHPPSSKLKTVNSSMLTLGDVEAGDIIAHPYGGQQRVLAVKDWGMWDMYRVTFSDGTSTVCSPEHLWNGWESHSAKTENKDPSGLHYRKSWLYSTQQFLENMDKGKMYRIPLCEPVRGRQDPSGKLAVDPYVLGVVLGDGSFSEANSNLRVTNHIKDRFIMDEAMDRCGHEWYVSQSKKESPETYDYTLPMATKTHKVLFNLGLKGKRSWEKSIPERCLTMPVGWRWELLQGLMDTDGWVEEKRCAFFTTVSPYLRNDVAELARSLGCFVTITNKYPHFYDSEGNKKHGREAYTLRIKSATPEKLFKLPRKKEMASRLDHQSLSKMIVDIEKVPREHCICIQVNHPSGLYLTDNYTVTHNSALLALLALLKHHRTVVYRWDKVQLNGFVDDVVQFYGTQAGLNRQNGYFYFGDTPGHMLEWAGIGKPGHEKKWQGRPHDLIGVDEATQLPLLKLLYLKTWLRTTKKGQRCRIVHTFNPPGAENEEGEMDDGKWVIEFYAPWVDERHPNPAAPGEIRYFLTNEGGEVEEVETAAPVEMKIGGKVFVNKPEARTFIPASVQDNIYLKGTEYEQSLLNLPDEIRARMLMGDFRSGIVDNPWQMLPSQWVEDAMDRWEPSGAKREMSALGVDVARGGRAFTVLAARHGFWWDRIARRPGKDTPDGTEVAGMCVEKVRDAAWINIDANGIGASPYDHLKRSNMRVKGIISQARKGMKKLPDGAIAYNKRAWLYWMLRCILDPKWDLKPSLPPDKRLRSDLVAIKFSITNNGEILAESKEDIKERLRRSTDDGDAIAMSVDNIYTEPEMDRLRFRAAPLVYANDIRTRDYEFEPVQDAYDRKDSNWMMF